MSKWGALKRELADQGIVLQAGTVISVSGYADLYAPQGKIGFTVMDVNVQDLLGDMAKRRLELIERLTKDHVLGEGVGNKSAAMVPVPLRIGLVASPGTEGYADFTGQFLQSRFSFAITLVKTLVQGEGAPTQIAAAIAALDALALDVICVVRGGGSKGDLACFDDEGVARAIGAARTPVWTGIGHTGDVSIADLAAHTYAITPTKLGERLVTVVQQWHDQHVLEPATFLHSRTTALLEQETEFLAERRRTMMFAVRDRLVSEQRHLRAVGQRLALHAEHRVQAAAATLAATRQLLGAYDPQRRLAQGWALVTDAEGHLVRSVTAVTRGQEVRISVRDGHLGATITETESREL